MDQDISPPPLRTLSNQPVGRFAFGCMQFGGRADAAQSAQIYADCRAAGLRHFDTAWVYTDGQSETILGQLIKDERDEVLIASKVGYLGGAGAENLQAQFDTSRKRLGLDCIDVLYLHRFDPDTDLQHTLDWFSARKQAGDIRYMGLSNFAAWQVMKAQILGGKLGLSVDILQPMYSLVKRQAEVEILPMCSDQGIAVAPYSPLGGGLLTGKYAQGGTGRLSEDARYKSRYEQDWMHDTAIALSQLASDMGQHPVTLAVAWVAAHASSPMPIISGRSADQIQPALAALDFDMTDELYGRISALSQRPAPATDRLEEQEASK